MQAVRPLVTLQLCKASQTFPARGADMLARAVLVPQVPGHVVRLAEGQGADGAAERFLFRVRSHVPSELVCVSEALIDTDGTVGAFKFGRRYGKVFMIIIVTIIIIIIIIIITSLVAAFLLHPLR